jgi:hypothetical protein
MLHCSLLQNVTISKMKSDNFEAYKKGLSDSVVMLYMPNSDLDKLYIFTWIFSLPYEMEEKLKSCSPQFAKQRNTNFCIVSVNFAYFVVFVIEPNCSYNFLYKIFFLTGLAIFLFHKLQTFSLLFGIVSHIVIMSLY